MAPIDRYNRPIITGAPGAAANTSAKTQTTTQVAQEETAVPFLSVLQQQLENSSHHVAFSKHAVNRVMERQIDVSDENLERLDQGVQLAQEKGLRDALILIDRSAYIVNATTGKVITVDGDAEQGSVYTNIDGTVIV